MLRKISDKLKEQFTNETVQLGIQEEVGFWHEWLKTQGGAWPEDFQFRSAYDTSLQTHITDVIEIVDHDNYRILDVGAGPLTYLGKCYKDCPLQITAIDPLAEEYDKLLDEYQINPPLRTRKGFAERLLLQFLPNSFDLVHARNCIDHSQNPCLAIQQMVAVAKPDGYVYMHHAVNEAKTQEYQGFHQWNLYDSQGELWASSSGEAINVSKALAGIADVHNQLFDNGIWMVTVIRKRSVPLMPSLAWHSVQMCKASVNYLQSFAGFMNRNQHRQRIPDVELAESTSANDGSI